MNKAEFKLIFDNYFEDIRRFVYYRCSDEELSSDIAQDVFMKVWEKRAQFSNEKVKALLYKIANDMVISDYRRNTTKLNFSKNMVLEDHDLTPQNELEFEELKQRYADVLEMLPENQRSTFLMSRNDELKYNEIAQRLDISVKTVEKRISATLQLLKVKLL